MRKAKPTKRVILPDPVFGEVMVAKFVNHLMLDGKKNTAYGVFYTALDTVEQKMKAADKTPLEVWKQALDNITPLVEVKSKRIGGATFQVPTEIRADRKQSIAMKNMINFARKRGGHSMAEKLAAEIMDAFNNQGGAFKRKEDMHRMAEANRAFAHFRFSCVRARIYIVRGLLQIPRIKYTFCDDSKYSFVILNFSLHPAAYQPVTMLALLPPSARHAAKENFQNYRKVIYRSPL